MFSLFRSVPSISIRDFSAALTAKRKVIDVRRPLNTGWAYSKCRQCPIK